MTNIFHSQNLEKDYTKFQKAFLKTNTFKHTLSPKIKTKFKKYHHLTYVIALFNTKLESFWNERNRYLFLNEILSDLLLNLTISFIGFHRASEIILRRNIENFYNHIYYFEHPVEYQLLNLGKNDYVPIQNLRSYFEEHPTINPELSVDSNIKKYNDQLFLKYQELCRTVHTKGEAFMGLAKNLEEIKPKIDFASHLQNMNQTIQFIIYLLFKFHTELTFSNTERNIVSNAFSRDVRRLLFS